MRKFPISFKLAAGLALGLSVFTGCESTGGSGANSSANVYYGVGFYDPWYYGDYHDYDGDITVTPPPARPDRPNIGARPEQPIARPPASASPRPAPSIPSAPRPAARPAGRR